MKKYLVWDECEYEGFMYHEFDTKKKALEFARRRAQTGDFGECLVTEYIETVKKRKKGKKPR